MGKTAPGSLVHRLRIHPRFYDGLAVAFDPRMEEQAEVKWLRRGLQAAHAVVLQARTMGYLGVESSRIAEMMDGLEYVMDGVAKNDRVRAINYLDEMARRFPELGYAAAVLRGDLPGPNSPV